MVLSRWKENSVLTCASKLRKERARQTSLHLRQGPKQASGRPDPGDGTAADPSKTLCPVYGERQAWEPHEQLLQEDPPCNRKCYL